MKAVVHFCDPDSFGLSSRTDAKAARAISASGLEEKRAERIGAAIHYVFGIATGAAYAAVSDRYPRFRAGRGAAFGAGLWLFADELAVTVARLENPRAANARSHASALAAHVLYGFIVDACSLRAT
jgi:uncharacterized membrane protein YagU involved in acid resistance